MNKYFATIFLLLLSSVVVLAQDNSTIFTLQGDGETPLIEHTARSRDNADYPYGEQYTDPGAVIFHDGQFHIFRNGFTGWPARVWIHYMVSDDGIEWEQPSTEPVLLTDDVPFAQTAALASSVIVEEDGTWVLYFYSWNGGAFAASNGDIGRATADNPQGTWTVDPDPVLTPGEDDAWDASGVASPQVVRNDDGYFMYYEGMGRGGVRAVGMATSEDGVNWTKYENNPILMSELDWEGNRLHTPRIIQVNDIWFMVYRTQNGTTGGSMRLGRASSEDGITWTRLSDEPMLSPDMLNHHRAFWFNAMTKTEDTAYLFVELMPGNNVTDIFLFTAPLDTVFDD